MVNAWAFLIADVAVTIPFVSPFRPSPSRFQARRGFTLIEIAAAIFLAMLLLMLAIPALDGAFAATRLQKRADAMNDFVAGARELAMSQNRTVVMVWEKAGVRVIGDGFTAEKDAEPLAGYTAGEGEVITLYLPSSLEKKPPPEWTFWPNGTCEPATLTFAGPAGTWEIEYSPLCARPRVKSFIAK